MGVEVLGAGAGEINGHGDAFESFVQANEQNARMLLNVAEGKKKNTPRPIYDPRHPDAEWPKMVYHAEKGQLIIGRPLKGIEDHRLRKQRQADNEAELKAAYTANYRDEPFLKPQIAVLDPALEKMAQKKENEELRGQITALNDLVQKLMAGKPA